MNHRQKNKVIEAIFGIIAIISINLAPIHIPHVSAQNAVKDEQIEESSSQNLPKPAVGGISSKLREIGSETKLPSYDAGHASQNYQAGASQITSIIYFILDFFKYIFGSIAVLMITISGVKLVMAGRTATDVMSKEKTNLRLGFSGLIIILVADQLIKNIFFGVEGEMYRSGTDIQMAAEKGTEFAMGIAGLIRVFIPSIAVLFFVIAGVRLVFSAGDSTKLTKAKQQMLWSVIGLMIAGLSEIIVFQILFPNQGGKLPDTQEFARLVVQITNFISGFISTIAVSMLIYSGYLYVASGGGQDLEKAKKVLTGAIIGLLIAMAAFGLVNTLIKLEPLTNTPQPKEVTIPNT